MCGIAGILDASGVGTPELQSMAHALAHRGPDEAGVHVEGGLGFAFRRLAIIDLAGGMQPISNEDGSVLVVFNGEIYNYRELRERLKRRGHRFSTGADTEVLVHLYEDRGPDLVDELRGMFAFAIWDRKSRRLVLARDHLGQKPLFWARDGSRFLFASEIKGILAAAPGFRRVNPEALHEYLTLRVVVDPRSMFEGIHKLPPGHLLEVEDGKAPTSRRYWNLEYEPKQPLREAEALERLDDALRKTVRLHLVSDVEVGAFLSGGIDSGITTAMMASLTGGPLKTFSGGTPYRAFDERPAARAVAERYGTDHHETTIRGDCVSLLPRVLHHLDEPSDSLSVCTYVLAERIRREVKVAVGGDGGDELFGGYDRYYGARYARYWAVLPRLIREGVVERVLRMASDESWYKSIGHQIGWLNELAGLPADRRYARSLSYFYFTPRFREELYTDRFRRAVDGIDPEEAISFWEREGQAKEALDRMLLADSMVRLPNHAVMILDRMTMAHGLEARSPYMDHRLVEFGASLPGRLKIRGRRRRYLQMRLAERYLPQACLERPKQGFNSAVPYMMAEHFDRLFQHYLPTSRLVEADYLRRPAVERLLAEHLAGAADHGNRLWLLLSAELWHRLHIDETSAADLEEQVEEVLGEKRDRTRPEEAARVRVG